jgi:hypothetical protein
MEIPEHLTVQYSTVNKQVNYSTVQYSNLTDVLNEDYLPWYDKRRKALGDKRFMELVNRARQGSDTPKILFRWMLNNPDLVK